MRQHRSQGIRPCRRRIRIDQHTGHPMRNDLGRAAGVRRYDRHPAGHGLDDDAPERLRITLAVAGFSEEDLDVSTEENQLLIRGRQVDQGERDYLYRGIAARQFQRTFVLADGMQVLSASLKNGLLLVDLIRPEPARMVKKINISVSQ